MIKKWHVYLLLISLVSGFLGVSLIRANQAMQAAQADDKTYNLISIIEQQENEIASLEESIAPTIYSRLKNGGWTYSTGRARY